MSNIHVVRKLLLRPAGFRNDVETSNQLGDLDILITYVDSASDLIYTPKVLDIMAVGIVTKCSIKGSGFAGRSLRVH